MPSPRNDSLECLRAALEAGDDGERQRRIRQLLHLGYCLADGDAAGQIERDRHRRKLARVVDGERPETRGEAGNGAQWDELAGRRADVQFGQHGGVALKAILHLENDKVFVVGCVDGGGLALAVGAVERVFHGLRGDAERRGLVAVHHHVGLGIADLQVCGDVGEAGQLRHFGGKRLRVSVEFVGLRADQGELILALGQLPADANRGRVLQEHAYAGKARELGL